MTAKKYYWVLFVFSIFWTFYARGQNNPYNEVSIASPTVAALGKYGDIPVSYSTGIPQISIPIYTVKEGNLTLPISLSYHSGGLKVMEAASWVGAGWSLNAGGVISRTVVGGPDERGTNFGMTELNGHFSDYGYNSYLSGGGQQQDWNGFAEGRKDGESDLFFYNFGNYSGKFFFRDDRTPILVPQQDLKIEPYYTGSGNIQSFTMTTPEGTRYSFGNTSGISGATPIEISKPYTVQNGASTGTVVSSWYLNKITSADGIFSISLKYLAENYGSFTISMFPIDGESNSSVYEYNLVKNIVQGVRLDSILFSNGAVVFIPGQIRSDLSDVYSGIVDNVNTQSKALGAIRITNFRTLCKQFNLSTSYFQDNSNTPLPGYFAQLNYNINTDKKRLRLDSLTEVICDSIQGLPPYKFSYFPENIPRRISFAQDHWGFYNGANTNQNLIPTYTLNNGSTITTKPGANRDAAWPQMRAGTISSLTYPTGGSSIFDFESHDVTASSTTYDSVIALSLTIRQYGQSAFSQTLSFFANGAYGLTLANTSIYNGNLEIRNASNILVYNINMPYGTSFSTTVNLNQGNYNVTLRLPTSATTGGAQATFKQFQPITTISRTLVGGLRIKKMTQVDGVTSRNIETNYSYTNGSQSTGNLYNRPVYVQIIRNDLVKNVGSWNPATGFQNPCNPNGCLSCPTNATYYKSPNSIRPMSTVQGSHIGYSKVKVSQTGNGYSLYNYFNEVPWNSNSSDVAIRYVDQSICDANVPNFPPGPPPLEYKRGELSSEEHYNESGQLLNDVYYYPDYDLNPTLSTPGFIVSSLLGSPVTSYLGTMYTQNTFRKKQERIVTTNYVPGVNSQTTSLTKVFESVFHNEPTSQWLINSTGDTLISKYKYAFDFRISTADAVSDCSPAYNSNCSNCLTVYNNGRAACSTDTCRTRVYLNYQQCLTNARVTYVSCRGTNYMNANSAFKTAFNNAKSGADAQLKPVLELQDKFQNPVIESSQWKNNLLLEGNYNTYSYALSPTTAVYPSKNLKLNLSTASSTFTTANTNANNNSIIRDSRYIEESSILIKNGIPLQIKTKSSPPVAYLWDKTNNYPIAKAVNANNTDIAYTSFEDDNKGGWNYSGTPFALSTAPSGQRVYSVNNNPITKSDLDVTKSYIISCWTNYLISIIGATRTKFGPLINGWQLLEFRTNPSVNSINITSPNHAEFLIDELRIAPVSAQMKTFMHEPLVGILNETDEKNNITYYEYDKYSRLTNIRDFNRNILKRFQYSIQGKTSNSSLNENQCQINFFNVDGDGMVVTYTNIATNQIFSFVFNGGPGILGYVPPGIYNITFSDNGTGVPVGLRNGNQFYEYYGPRPVTFYNIKISSFIYHSVQSDL